MRNRQQDFKILADAIIPLLGFFLWNWGIYFIFLFYALDLISREILVYFKSRKIETHQPNSKGSNLFYPITSGLVIITLIGLMHLISYSLKPQINFQHEILSFLTYSDMGIQQGYILLPLIAFAAFAQYKSEFIFTQKYLVITKVELWRTHIRATIFLLFLGIAVLGLSFFLKNQEWIIVLAIVLSIGIFQFVFGKTKT